MKKIFMILCLSLFAVSLNASGSIAEVFSDNLRTITDYDDLKVGDYIVRPLPCPACVQDRYGWKVIEKVADHVYVVQCVVCGYEDVL